MSRALCLVAALVLSNPAAASTLQLDQASSDSTPASFLRGSIGFEVAAGVLTVTVSNDTAGTATPYSIYSVMFNVSADVRALTYSTVFGGGYGQPGQWTPYASGYYVTALRFGAFDYSLWQWSHEPITPGETYRFALVIDCVAGRVCDAADFGIDASVTSVGGTPALAAARWGDGPGGDAAFSAALVPEPTTLALLALSAPLLARRRRKTTR